METLPPRGGVAVEARIAHDLVVEPFGQAHAVGAVDQALVLGIAVPAVGQDCLRQFSDRLVEGASGTAAVDQPHRRCLRGVIRSEAHTSELQSLMRFSYALLCLKPKT